MRTFQETEKPLCSKYVWWIEIKSVKQPVFKILLKSIHAIVYIYNGYIC